MDNKIISYIFQGLGIFIGIVAGTVVTLLIQWVAQRGKEEETVKYLKFEIDLNIGKIIRWLDQVDNYRNAVNSDTLSTYWDYFDLSRVATSFYNNTFYSGLLYKYLNFDDINQLQIIFSEFSITWENLLNEEIKKNRNTFIDERKKFDKALVTQQINFWEKKFKAHKKTLEEIKKRFDKR